LGTGGLYVRNESTKLFVKKGFIFSDYWIKRYFYNFISLYKQLFFVLIVIK
jgi:hypothetical protein